jgi:hypothetical protein
MKPTVCDTVDDCSEISTPDTGGTLFGMDCVGREEPDGSGGISEDVEITSRRPPANARVNRP